MDVVKMIAAGSCLIIGMVFFLLCTFGVNRFKRSLNRIHAAAVGDTLGLLFTMAGLIIWRGFSFTSLKLLAVVVFFWLASPVAAHMLARLEVETHEDLGEIEVDRR